LTNISIRNGIVVAGLMMVSTLPRRTNCVIEDLRLSKNGGHGLVVGDGHGEPLRGFGKSRGWHCGGKACSILNCTTFTNGTNGMRIRGAGVVRNCGMLRNGRSDCLPKKLDGE
jgi:hypothetical protein